MLLKPTEDIPDWLKAIGISNWKRKRSHCNEDTMKMHALMELTSIKSKCIFHNANENGFVQHHAMSCTQKLYLQWLTSQKRMAFRWGRRQVRREKRKVRDRLLEAACFKPGFEGGMISLFDEYSTHAYMQHKIKKLRLLT